MRKLLLLGTGGTIACRPMEKGLSPALTSEQLLGFLSLTPEQEIHPRDLFNLDSSNIQPEEWRMLASALKDAANEYGGIVVTHGTDTMGYTASMLSFMLQNLPVPVVLTGSQYPMVYPDSDGRRNLKNAIIATAKLPGGVYVAFGDAIIRGCRAVKVRTTSLNAFESINCPYVGAVANEEYIPLNERKSSGTFCCCNEIEPNVALVKLIPGTGPEWIRALADHGIRGVVVEAFGLGGMHNDRRDHAEAFAHLMERGIPVVLTSQCLYEQSWPGVYAVSSDLVSAGVISAYDMTTEAAVTKLMWVLGRTRNMKKVRQWMHTDLAGEINLPNGGKS